MPSNDPTSRALDYAADRPLRRRRWIAVVVVLGSIGLAAYWERAQLEKWYEDARFVAAQRRCLNASLPPNTLVAEATRSKENIDAVLRDPAFVQSRYDLEPTMYAAYRTWGDEAALGKLGATAIEGPFHDEGLVFLHELRKSDGQRRLVRVGIWCLRSSQRRGCFYISMRTAVYTVAGFGQRPSQLGGWTIAIGDDDPFGPAKEIRFFVGAVDATNAGAFKIPLEVDGRAGVDIGKLTDDDRIEMRWSIPPQ